MELGDKSTRVVYDDSKHSSLYACTKIGEAERSLGMRCKCVHPPTTQITNNANISFCVYAYSSQSDTLATFNALQSRSYNLRAATIHSQLQLASYLQ